ncbi:MAG: hypothetical protein IT376_13115 [Polyangiaceae bacterium]|nr:hypothetical protein [Polyangiaceae bacterium]
MNATPLHPAIVHVPLVLALVTPLLAGWAAWATHRARGTNAAWRFAAALELAVLVTAIAALRTGEAEEDQVERLVPHAALETHEDRGKLFAGSALVTALLLVGAAAAHGRERARLATTLGALGAVTAAASAGLGIATGSAGGELVYVHGAAAAHVRPAAPGSGAAAPAAPRPHDD